MITHIFLRLRDFFLEVANCHFRKIVIGVEL